MDFHRVAHVEQEARDHGLAPVAGEEIDFLLLALIENVKIGFVEIGNEPALIVRNGNGDNHFVYLNADGSLCAKPESQPCGSERRNKDSAVHPIIIVRHIPVETYPLTTGGIPPALERFAYAI